MTDENFVNLAEVGPDEVPQRRDSPVGPYSIRVVSFERGETERGKEFYEVTLRILDPLSGQDLTDCKRFVRQRFYFNKYDGERLMKLMFAVNPAWAKERPRPKFPAMLEASIGADVQGELTYQTNQMTGKSNPRFKGFRRLD